MWELIIAKQIFGHFMWTNFGELGFTEDFVGINFRKLSLAKVFAGINLFKRALFKDSVRGSKFNVCLEEIFTMTLVYDF